MKVLQFLPVVVALTLVGWLGCKSADKQPAAQAAAPRSSASTGWQTQNNQSGTNRSGGSSQYGRSDSGTGYGSDGSSQ